MELRQLRYFKAVAETLSFSEAARQLYISQSTLSQQIQQLEEELQVQLFKRTSHSVALSEAGERLVDLAAETLQRAEECRTQMQDMQKGLGGNLTIGVTYSGSAVLAEPIREFIRLYPKVKINVRYTNNQNLVGMLRRKEVDLALAIRVADMGPDIESEVLLEDRLCAICCYTHALITERKGENISIRELAPYPMALPAERMQVRIVTDRLCEQNNVRLKEQITMDDPERLLDLVEQSRLVTIQAGISTYIHSGLARIPIAEAEPLYGCVHTLKGRYRKRSAEVFIQMVRESLSLAKVRMR